MVSPKLSPKDGGKCSTSAVAVAAVVVVAFSKDLCESVHVSVTSRRKNSLREVQICLLVGVP